ncbi:MULTISPECIES: M15 family metallopeptidase [Aphanothece]|uniref:M15 family metallopeptidase n=1 Tax=Aphanothece TaxID=1121 RepID=UPI003984C2C7
MALRPWNGLAIQPSSEPLCPLPAELLRLEPHPYSALGAPYGAAAGPFQLRQGVIERLLMAQASLQRLRPEWRLAIFDGWRPVAVQAFMVEHTIRQRCAELGLDPDAASPAREAVEVEVARFWAPPSPDPLSPPPHSTGAAVDLTLADQSGLELAMGSPIDALGAVSEPDHFGALAQRSVDQQQRQEALLWHGRRALLRQVMEASGFAQHPNEWWHFSWGDQLWAWRTAQPAAFYGRVEPVV